MTMHVSRNSMQTRRPNGALPARPSTRDRDRMIEETARRQRLRRRARVAPGRAHRVASIAVHDDDRRGDARARPRQRVAVARRGRRALVPRHRLRAAVVRRRSVVDAAHRRFIALMPWYYAPMVISFALLVGWAENRMGTRLAAAVTDRRPPLRGAGDGSFPRWPSTAWLGVVDADRGAAGRRVLGGRRWPPGRRIGHAAAAVASPRAARVRDLRHHLGDLHRLASPTSSTCSASPRVSRVGPQITRSLRPTAASRPSRREWRLIAVAVPAPARRDLGRHLPPPERRAAGPAWTTTRTSSTSASPCSSRCC